ncbi:LPXTG-motif cell wall-anchored protein [Ilumatobacter fluminis]|uniref:LPXTG-motif cell wall-anchored protein n=1 Tax=Ilumatobacter fluminis TaxID=467091 RepID=A0A4R7HX86_9ACTN|nr:LPXTG cell wall anchor domain-containing protein [Ilumatobacter fluminis]TDT14816.1 LPXTG-motif cell wall-anchored protein [Ilumatobacter fluminis]
MRNNRRILAAAAAMAGISTLGVAASAEAGVPQGQIRVTVQIVGEAAADGLNTAIEIYDNGVLDTADCDDVSEPVTQDTDVYLEFTRWCDLEPGTDYSLGLDPLPANYDSYVSCGQPQLNERIVDDGNSLTIAAGALTDCWVVIGANMAVLTKEVVVPLEGGPETPADPADFVLEVYNGDGGLHDSGSVATSPECDWLLGSDGVPCFYTDLESGDYSFGEQPVQGYFGAVTECDSDVGPDERFDDALNQTVTVDPTPFGRWFTCNVRNTYAEGEITLTKTLVNDDGGTATMSDFTLELYEGGTIIDSGMCAADGSCLTGTYPVGSYTVGETGPDGYTRTVTQEVLVPTEQLADAEAQIELGPLEQVTVNVESDDTPTTTTTTLAPTTTALQTTTTAFDAGSVTLPPTGDDSSTNIALIAAGLLLLGGAGLVLSRR